MARPAQIAHARTLIVNPYLPGQVYIPVGILDQAGDLAPQLHTHESQRLPWLHIDDDLERFATTSRSRLADTGK